MMADIGVPELLIILAIAIVLFGPARIGGIGKSIGEAIRGFRQAVRDEQRAPASQEQTPAQQYATDNQPLLKESTNRQE
jgi:sec-independent protein translocase protein TatA